MKKRVIGIIILLVSILEIILSTKSMAATSNTVEFYNNLSGKKIAAVTAKKLGTRSIGAMEVYSLNYAITNLSDSNGNNLFGRNCSTGDIVSVGNNKYTAVVYGDINCDGKIGDINDILMIIKSYLGRITLTPEQKLAANLSNYDEKLDIDDILVIIKAYLAKGVCEPKKKITGAADIGEATEGICSLKDVARVGDIVQWGKSPKGDTLCYNWIVLKNDGNNVSLLATVDFGKATASSQVEYCNLYEQTDSAHYKSETVDEKKGSPLRVMIGNMIEYFDEDVIKEVRFLKQSEYNLFKTESSLRTIFNMYLNSEYTILAKIGGKYQPVLNTTGTLDTSATYNVRPVYVLKNNVNVVRGRNGAWRISQ